MAQYWIADSVTAKHVHQIFHRFEKQNAKTERNNEPWCTWGPASIDKHTATNEYPCTNNIMQDNTKGPSLQRRVRRLSSISKIYSLTEIVIRSLWLGPYQLSRNNGVMDRQKDPSGPALTSNFRLDNPFGLGQSYVRIKSDLCVVRMAIWPSPLYSRDPLEMTHTV